MNIQTKTVRHDIKLDTTVDSEIFNRDLPANFEHIYHYVNIQNPTTYQLELYAEKHFNPDNDIPFAIIPPTSYQSINLPYDAFTEYGIRTLKVTTSNLDYTPPIIGSNVIIIFTVDSLNWNFNAGLDIYAQFNAYQESLLQLPDGYPSGNQNLNVINGLNDLQEQMALLTKISTAGNFFVLSDTITAGSLWDNRSLFSILLEKVNIGNTGDFLIPSYVTDFKIERLNPSVDGSDSTGFAAIFLNPFGGLYGNVPFNYYGIYTTRDKIFLQNKQSLAKVNRFYYIDSQTGTKVYTGRELIYPETIIDTVRFQFLGMQSALGRISGNVYFEEVQGIETEIPEPTPPLTADSGNFLTSDFNLLETSDGEPIIVGGD